MTQTLFVTSSGTEIGKTFITCELCRSFRQHGKRVQALKPVITGWDDSDDTDTIHLLKSLDLPITKENINLLSPWRFSLPLSPDMAAREENKVLPFDEIVAFCQKPRPVDYLFIEGIGGAMVPLTPQHTIRDLIQALHIPVILVVGSYLGSLSHTLSTIEALQQAQINIQRIILNESEDSLVPLKETSISLSHFTTSPISVITRNNRKELALACENVYNQSS